MYKYSISRSDIHRSVSPAAGRLNLFICLFRQIVTVRLKLINLFSPFLTLLLKFIDLIRPTLTVTLNLFYLFKTTLTVLLNLLNIDPW